jgi:hypothetical protein
LRIFGMLSAVTRDSSLTSTPRSLRNWSYSLSAIKPALCLSVSTYVVLIRMSLN